VETEVLEFNFLNFYITETQLYILLKLQFHMQKNSDLNTELFEIVFTFEIYAFQRLD